MVIVDGTFSASSRLEFHTRSFDTDLSNNCGQLSIALRDAECNSSNTCESTKDMVVLIDDQSKYLKPLLQRRIVCNVKKSAENTILGIFPPFRHVG